MNIYLILYFLPFLSLSINHRWIDGLRFFPRAPDLLAKHYSKVESLWTFSLAQADSLQKHETAHNIPTPQGSFVLVSSRQHVKGLGKASSDQMSLATFFSDVSRFRCSDIASLS
jgi:hypothetical protein